MTLAEDNNSTLFRRGVLSPRAEQTDAWNPHIMGQVDVAHAKGWTGQGVKVSSALASKLPFFADATRSQIGIVDTGVDYLHPILNLASSVAPCFGPGCLLSFGYDFTGDDAAAGIKDADPYTNCSDHGTHVTGIVAAQDNSFGFSGVAKGAQVGHYRVFGCTGESSTDVVSPSQSFRCCGARLPLVDSGSRRETDPCSARRSSKPS